MTTYSVVPIGSDKTLLPSDSLLAVTVMVVIKNTLLGCHLTTEFTG